MKIFQTLEEWNKLGDALFHPKNKNLLSFHLRIYTDKVSLIEPYLHSWYEPQYENMMFDLKEMNLM